MISNHVSSDSKVGNKTRLLCTDGLFSIPLCTLGTIGTGKSLDKKHKQVELMVNLNPKNVMENDDSLSEID